MDNHRTSTDRKHDALRDPERLRNGVDDAIEAGRDHLRSRMDSFDENVSPVLGEDPLGEREETKNTRYMLLLTAGMFGLQVAWAVELASASPFLLSLGLSKSLLALVWIAGPLSGTVVAPYIGVKSDDCRLRWGRRRPFMAGGTIVTIICLLLFCWTREIVTTILGIFGVNLESKIESPAFQIFAVVIIWVLDFALNTVGSASRAFLVDSVPTHQQEIVNAWAIRISGAGNILAYAFGFVDLVRWFPWLGNSQFKVFGALASILMAITMALTCYTVHERDPRHLGLASGRGNSVKSLFKALYRSARKLPPQVKKVCLVQVWAWIGWFPFLFYTSTYVGGLYAEKYFAEDPNLSEHEIDEIWERGTRAGSFALFIFALITFAASVLVPMMVPPTYQAANGMPYHNRHSRTRSNSIPFSKLTSRTVHISEILDAVNIQIPGLTLRLAWLYSHIAFAVLMFMTIFVSTTSGATVLVGLVGISWALTNWAPFALIAAEISRQKTKSRGSDIPLSSVPGGPLYSPVGIRTSQDFGVFADRETVLHGIEEEAPPTAVSAHLDDAAADEAGVLLGIHNVAVAAPQVLATLASSLIFQATQKERGMPGDDSVGWVLRFGGVCALVAAWMCRTVEEHASR